VTSAVSTGATATTGSTGASTDGRGGRGGGGNDPLAPIGWGDGTCETPPCGPPTARIERPDPCKLDPKLCAPRSIDARLLIGRRTEGKEHIAPPDSVRRAMVREGRMKIRAVTRMCLDARGAVSSVDITASSGHAEYDAEILREMRAWRYDPYTVNGTPVPVCTEVTFVYTMR
jgi:TonB family protein